MTRRSRAGFDGRPLPTRQGPASLGSDHHRAVPGPRPVRIAVFALIALLVTGAAAGLVMSRLQGAGGADVTAIQVHASMGGFDPPALTVKAGETIRVEFSSMDTPFHSDGGGWHQFAIDALGIDWNVGPQSSEVFEMTAPDVAGSYTFYCDVCCGGKENPSMQGTLTVTA